LTLLANAVKSTFLTLSKERFLFVKNTILQKYRVHKFVCVPVIKQGGIEEISIINTPKVVKEIDSQTALSLFVGGCLIRDLRSQTTQYYRNDDRFFTKCCEKMSLILHLQT